MQFDRAMLRAVEPQSGGNRLRIERQVLAYVHRAAVKADAPQLEAAQRWNTDSKERLSRPMMNRFSDTSRNVLFTCLWCLSLVSVANADLPPEVRVLTYNIHHGEGTDGKIDLPRIAEVIKTVSPHVVALQEVDQQTARSGGVDQPAELARLTGMEVVFGRNIDFQGGGYGTAVLSTLPIKARASYKLPSFYQGTPDHPEQRGVQVVELGAPGEPGMVVLCTHFDYRPDDRERMASAVLVNELAAKYAERPMILAGDLNATPNSRILEELGRYWKTATNGDAARLLNTFPVDQPSKQIDFILYRPSGRWQVIETRVLEERLASDHRALLAVLRRMP
jgi:endonuclease/exonuclease/phosphatase family metal-dependent hydrolase